METKDAVEGTVIRRVGDAENVEAGYSMYCDLCLLRIVLAPPSAVPSFRAAEVGRHVRAWNLIFGDENMVMRMFTERKENHQVVPVPSIACVRQRVHLFVREIPPAFVRDYVGRGAPAAQRTTTALNDGIKWGEAFLRGDPFRLRPTKLVVKSVYRARLGQNASANSWSPFHSLNA